MPGRTVPLVKNEIYHVFNRGIASQPTFLDKRDYSRALETILYYQNINLPIKYSRFLTLSVEERQGILENLKSQENFLVEIITYCLMPNHFHFQLRQMVDGGISKFMSNFINSYTRFLNTKKERIGQLFAGKFKAVRMETEEQLLHVSRYIHLNPYTAYVVKTLENLENFPYSSFGEYIQTSSSRFCSKEIILNNFKKNSYKQFVFDQAGYQRSLDKIKHLILE